MLVARLLASSPHALDRGGPLFEPLQPGVSRGGAGLGRQHHGARGPTDDGWRQATNLSDITTANGQVLGTYPLDDKDAVLVVTLAPGSYTAQVSGVNGATGVALVEVDDFAALFGQ